MWILIRFDSIISLTPTNACVCARTQVSKVLLWPHSLTLCEVYVSSIRTHHTELGKKEVGQYRKPVWLGTVLNVFEKLPILTPAGVAHLVCLLFLALFSSLSLCNLNVLLQPEWKYGCFYDVL